MWMQLLSGDSLSGFRKELEDRQVLEVGDGCKFVPLDRLLAEVKVFKPERDAAQEVVFTQRLSAEHAQLKFPQAQGFLAVATVHQLWKEEDEDVKLSQWPYYCWMTTRTRLCHNKLFSDHLIESRVSGFPRDFCLAFGSLVRIWKQVGFNVGVGICSIFRNLKRSMSNINMMRKNIKTIVIKTMTVITRSRMCITMMKRVLFL